MKRYQVNFFATAADLEALLRVIETKEELQFVRTGLFDVPIQNRLLTLFDADLGIAVKGDNNQEASYLVAYRIDSIQTRTVPQHGGGVKYAIDQQANPKTIVFRPGGVFSDACIIAGHMGTTSEESASLALFKLFSNEIKRQFVKVKSFYAGNKAVELLDKGWRLTGSVNSPPSYDLKRD
ncbi:MAG: hypothetical protein ACLQQ0_04805 [Limisphaerales bacterium]